MSSNLRTSVRLVALMITLGFAQSSYADAPVVNMDDYLRAQGWSQGNVEPVPMAPDFSSMSTMSSNGSDCGCSGGCSGQCSSGAFSTPVGNIGRSQQCGGGGCLDVATACDPCSIGRMWFDSDYLFWQTSAVKLPSLITGNPVGTPLANVGVIGAPGTRVLLGNESILGDARSGMRFRAGTCLCDGWSFEAEYFHLEDDEATYNFNSNRNLLLGRPFINTSVSPYRYDTQLIYLPPDVNGSVRVDASSEFQGAAARFKVDLSGICGASGCSTGCASGGCSGGYGCGDDCCSCECACPCPVATGVRMTLGYRYLDLNERIRIEEQLFAAGDQFNIFDEFRADSSFHGLEFGIDADFRWAKSCINLFGRLAGGANQNSVRIGGQTTDVIAGVRTNRNGGILAQSSNIGSHDQTVASMVAEFGFNLRTPITRRLSANVGYSMLYWGNVVRSGEQIDLHVNPNLFPPPIAAAGGIGAKPTHGLSDFFAHGLNAGLTFVF